MRPNGKERYMTTVTLTPADTVDAGRVDRRKRGIIAFLAIAFGLAWVPFLTGLIGINGPSAILMPFAPAIACFVVRRWITREGFEDAGLRLRLRLHHWPQYLIALTWPFAVTFLGVVLALALRIAPTGFSVPWGLASASPLSLLTWTLVSIPFAAIIFGEEFGWRGYLQVRLMADKPLQAAVATGLIWGVWHYPLILAGGEAIDDRTLTLLLFPLQTVLFSIFLGWLRQRTGSVWAGSMAHAANNGLGDNLGRLAFTGRLDGIYSGGQMLLSFAAESLVLGGIVLHDHLFRRNTTTEAERDAPGAVAA